MATVSWAKLTQVLASTIDIGVSHLRSTPAISPTPEKSGSADVLIISLTCSALREGLIPQISEVLDCCREVETLLCRSRDVPFLVSAYFPGIRLSISTPGAYTSTRLPVLLKSATL